MRYCSLILFIICSVIITGCRSARSTETEKVRAAQTDITDTSSATGEAESHVWDFRDATTWLLGDIDPVRFMNPPYSSWYISGYNDYQPDPAVVEELKEIVPDNLSVTIVLGTWCPDSRREVPRFMKLADLWGFPEDKIKFIGVDINKVAPLEDYKDLGIERVPTFIFYENNLEKGRIIEVPATSLEQDTRNILTGK